MSYQSGKIPPGQRLGMLASMLRDGRLALRLFSDPRMATAAKIVIPVLAVLYVLSPIDLIPDVIPVLGQMDDLAILALALRLFIGMAPPAVVAEYRAEMAGQPGQAQQPTGKTDAKGEVIDGDYRVIR